MCGLVCGVCVLRTLSLVAGWRGEIRARTTHLKSRHMLKKTCKHEGTPKCNLWKRSLRFRIWEDVRQRLELGLSKHTRHKKVLLGSKSTPKMDIIEGNLISKQENKRNKRTAVLVPLQMQLSFPISSRAVNWKFNRMLVPLPAKSYWRTEVL